MQAGHNFQIGIGKPPVSGFLNMIQDDLFGIVRHQPLQAVDDIGSEPLVFLGNRIENSAAADGTHRRVAPDHKVIVLDDRHRRIEPYLGKGGFTGSQLLPVDEDDNPENLIGTAMKPRTGTIFKGLFITAQIIHCNVDHITRFQGAGIRQHIAAIDNSLLEPLKVDGGSHTGFSLGNALIMNLEAPYLGRDPHRIQHHRIPHLNLP